MRSNAISLFAGLLWLFVASACATARGGAQPQPMTSSDGVYTAVDDVYARMTQALTRPGEAYHPTIQTVAVQGDQAYTSMSEAWLVFASKAGREQVTATFGLISHEATILIDGERQYRTQEDGSAPIMRRAVTCHDSDSALLSLLLACHGDAEQSITVVQRDVTFEDERAIAVITSSAERSPTEHAGWIQTLYVSAATYLPIAIQSNGMLFDESALQTAVFDTGALVRFTNNFVLLAALKPDFFSPAAVGWVEPNIEAPLKKTAPDFTYLWLGRTFDGAGPLPALALQSAYVADGARRPSRPYRALLRYRPSADEFGGVSLEVEEWRLDEWRAASSSESAGDWWDAPCVGRSDETDGDVAVAIFLAPAGCAGVDARAAAQMTIGSALVLVSPAPGSAYATEAGMRHVARSLRAYQ
jgi:hypothetical protein